MGWQEESFQTLTDGFGVCISNLGSCTDGFLMSLLQYVSQLPVRFFQLLEPLM